MPERSNGRAPSVFTAVANWSANLMVALSFLTLTQVLGKPATFWLYGVVTVGAWLFAFFLVPETKGKTLEEIEAHWRAGEASAGPMKAQPIEGLNQAANSSRSLAKRSDHLEKE